MNLLTAVEHHATLQPEAPALSDSGTTVSYAQLANKIKDCADTIGRMGIKRMGLLMDNCPDWVVIDLACIQAGITLIPMPHFFSGIQLQNLCASAQIDHIVTGFVSRIMSLDVAIEPLTQQLAGLAVFKTVAGNPLASDPEPAPAKITFTSGTTGDPKGVCLDQFTQDRVARSVKERLSSLGLRTHLCVLPLSTLLENVAGVYGTLMNGGCCQIPSLHETGFSTSSGFDPVKLASAFSRYTPNSAILVPELLAALVALAESGFRIPDSARFFAVGGASVCPQLLNRASNLGIPVYEGYGLSECGSVVSLNHPENHKPGSVGKPLPGLEVKIGANDEIIVKGRARSHYLGQPASAQGKPQETHTGDIGYLDWDGYLYITGRLKNLMITSFGRNISPEWIESALIANPVVYQCAVFGDARPFCSALIISRPALHESSAIAAAVMQANEKLPEYARIKKWIIASEPFTPKNGMLAANGSLQRNTISQHYAQAIAALYTHELCQA